MRRDMDACRWKGILFSIERGTLVLICDRIPQSGAKSTLTFGVSGAKLPPFGRLRTNAFDCS